MVIQKNVFPLGAEVIQYKPDPQTEVEPGVYRDIEGRLIWRLTYAPAKKLWEHFAPSDMQTYYLCFPVAFTLPKLRKLQEKLSTGKGWSEFRVLAGFDPAWEDSHA